MNHNTHLFVLAALFLIACGIGIAARGSKSDDDIVVAAADPAGTYIAFVPAGPASWHTVTLHLDADAARSAIMTEDYQDGNAIVAKRGTWADEDGRSIAVTLETDPQLIFSTGGNTLMLHDADPETYEKGSIAFMRSALPLRTRWQWIKTVRDEETIAPLSGAPFVLTLDPDLRLTVEGDCNTINGDFGLREGGRIVIGPLVSTKVFCEPSLEPAFIEDFGKATSYYLVDNELSFVASDERTVMTFTRYDGPTPDAPLPSVAP